MNNEWWIDFVAGWVSGAASVIACQPLDTILTRLQAAGNKQIQTQAFTTAGTTITGRQLISNYGISSLWKGSSSMIGAVPFQNALLMSGYGFGKRYAAAYDNSNENTNTLLPVFIGGCVGGILQSFLMSPIEWIKVNQQISITNNSTTTAGGTGTNVTKQFLQNKSNLWNRGLTATLLRDGIPHGVWFVSYEYCKTILINNNSSSSSSSSFYKTVTVPIVSGAFAATAAWTVGYPFDIIKTRIQANDNYNNHTIKGVYETGLILIKESNGNIIRGLYRGFTLKLIRAIPASMIGFFTYEYVASSI
ncbi:mitochondrial carrier [Fragilariopsis cylindrus CCMP1102]|uniref:Mitochondrial carrier n=1 Tax=Fragilariopsis cylindrus CCMP1102 TaxID=635003 RepID=A0A1E7FIV8_9STRA|nr:mitochondrial carrier [Fragilariopsis cylindrus CCMP1102]|eukprot:OEU18119.1 mitochondrial carrier [Fragilariopsis cylindrus CCMP1102]